MKSTKLILAGFAVVALLFSSGNVEAKNNYSNKVAKNEEKVKVRIASDYMPAITFEEAPVFSAYKATGFLEKYSPEQLNKLMGVWPERTEGRETREVVAVDVVENKDVKYTPEQFVEILGLTF